MIEAIKSAKLEALSAFIEKRQKKFSQDIKMAAEKSGIFADVKVHITLMPSQLEESENGGQ